MNAGCTCSAPTCYRVQIKPKETNLENSNTSSTRRSSSIKRNSLEIIRRKLSTNISEPLELLDESHQPLKLSDESEQRLELLDESKQPLELLGESKLEKISGKLLSICFFTV